MTYASRLVAKLDPRHPVNQSFPKTGRGQVSDEVAEEEFQKKLTGGFDRNRYGGICQVCFCARPVNGRCCEAPLAPPEPMKVRKERPKDVWLED